MQVEMVFLLTSFIPWHEARIGRKVQSLTLKGREWGWGGGERERERGEGRKRSSTYYTLWSILSKNVPISHWGGGGEEGRRGEGWGERERRVVLYALWSILSVISFLRRRGKNVPSFSLANAPIWKLASYC